MGKKTLHVSVLTAIAGALMVVPSGAAANTSASPTTLNFGSRQVGATSPSKTVAITVDCTASISFPAPLCVLPGIFIPPPSITGDFLQTNTCGAGISSSGLTPGTCTFTVKFKPTAAGTRTGTLTTGTDVTGSSPAPISLSGTGVASGSGAVAGKKKCKKKPRSAQTAKKRCKKHK